MRIKHSLKRELYYEKAMDLYFKGGMCGTHICKILPISRAILYKWIAIFAEENPQMSSMKRVKGVKKTLSPSPAVQGEEQPQTIQALQDELKRLREQLREAEIKAEAYDELINVAEAKFNIPIRKKSWRQAVENLHAKDPERYGVQFLCRLFGVSKQAYYKHDESKILARAAREAFALEYIRDIRSKDPGIGGTKLWHMYRRDFQKNNPAGRVWTREELTRIGEICLRNNVMVVADEIHCELVFGGHKYIPFASISEEFLHNCITCISPSKAFNIAGLQIANIVASDPEKKAKIDRAVNINEVCDVNPFGVNALIAAYNEGEEWLEQLLEYISGNWQYMKEFCAKKLPDFPLVELEGTYLAWMDCRKLAMPSMQLEEDLIEKTGLWLNAGSMYGEDGEGFMRWNLACPRARVIDGLGRFLKYISAAGK